MMQNTLLRLKQFNNLTNREFNSKILKNQKKQIFDKIFKEMKSKLKDLIVDSKEIEIIEKLEPSYLQINPNVCIYRGLYLFTKVEIKVIPLRSLDLNQLVGFI